MDLEIGKSVKVQGALVTPVFRFPVMYEGWEADNDAYLCRGEDDFVIVQTDCGKPYIAKAADVMNDALRYAEAQAKTLAALLVIKESPVGARALLVGRFEAALLAATDKIMAAKETP